MKANRNAFVSNEVTSVRKHLVLIETYFSNNMST